MLLHIFWILNCLHLKVFEGTSGIDNKYTTVQFTGEVITYPAICIFLCDSLSFDLVIALFLSIRVLDNWPNRQTS